MKLVAKHGLVIAAILWTALTAAHAQHAVKRLELVTPRPFGYVIGDKIEHRLHLELFDPFRLDESSLPEAGKLTRWLELAPPVIHTERRRDTTSYEILLTYQTFHAPSRLQSLAAPGFDLALSDGGGRRLPLLVPAWHFWVGPLAPARLAASNAAPALRPEHAPEQIPTAPHALRMLLFAAVLAAALLYLTYYMWGIPLLDRRTRPFARTLRYLRKLEHEPFSETLHHDALRNLHRAFNSTAGQTLFPENLDDFFFRHPEYKSLRGPIEKLFVESQGTFFDTARRVPAEIDSLERLVELCRKCRRIERAAA